MTLGLGRGPGDCRRPSPTSPHIPQAIWGPCNAPAASSPSPTYSATWLFGSGSCRDTFSCLCVRGRALGFKALTCHLQWENGLTTNSSCVGLVMRYCIYNFFLFKYCPLLWSHILKWLLSNLVRGIPWLTTQNGLLSSIPYARKAMKVSKVKTQRIQSLIGSPKARFGNNTWGNSESHHPDAFSFPLSFCS